MRKWIYGAALALGGSVVGPGSVLAGDEAPDTLFGQPVNRPPELTPEDVEARRRAFEEHLRANDLSLEGDVLVPRERLTAADRVIPDHDGTWHDPPHASTIFLNFFGGELSSGTNASEMESGCVGAVPIDYPGFTGSESAALAIIQVFENAMEPYAVRVAYEEAPPQHLPYSMVMMGGTPDIIGLGNGVLGVSCSSDCGDVWWHDTTFAFTEESSSPQTLGTVALQEAAHAFGLDHIDGTQNIMYPFATAGAKVWADTCTPYNDATGGISCTFVHEFFCPDGGAQNDDAELLAYFGPNAPDVEAPQVTIVEPADGLQLDVGSNITIAAEITDNVVGMGWRLVATPPGKAPQIVNAYDLATSWNLSGLSEGLWTFRVEAVDHDRNEGFAEVSVQVGEGGPATSDDSGSSGGAEETGVGTGGDTGAGSSGDTGGSASDGGEGCGCRHRSAPAGGLGLLVVLGAFRRRRLRG